METVFQREYLYKNAHVPLTGFKDKPINRLVSHKQTPSVLNIEVNHLKRDFSKDSRDIVPLLEYQLWLEAGKLDKANLRSPNADANVNINSNMWRNFCSTVGLQSTSALAATNRNSNNTTNNVGIGRNSQKSPRQSHVVTEAISTLYPLNIPMPSRLGPNTLSKYYEQNKRQLFANDKSFVVARERVEREDARMRLLRLKSEMRNPPLDWQGNIMPPSSFKKYPSTSATSRHTGLSDLSNPNLALTASAKVKGSGFGRDTSTDLTSEFTTQRITAESSVKKRPPVLKKLVHRQNHPDFDKVIKEQQLKDAFKISANLI